MAYILFIDESGQDHRDSPYEVLAGLAVEDRDLWNLILAVREAELRLFGTRYTAGDGELKAKRLLKSKTYRLANQLEPIPSEERTILARKCIEAGSTASRRELTALAQAKLAYVHEALELCARFRCKVFASIVDQTSPAVDTKVHLRKDYAYLFERFFYFLEDIDPAIQGLVVFDELEHSRSHLLIDQMHRYFQRTEKGRYRAAQVIPEPFFVHSELTTGIQLADLIAYLISWGFRTKEMGRARREELDNFVEQVSQMRHRTTREVGDNPNFAIWSFAIIHDLRVPEERK